MSKHYEEYRKFYFIASAAINDIIKEEKSDYDGAGSLKIWEKFSPEWFARYHTKIVKRFAERAADQSMAGHLGVREGLTANRKEAAAFDEEIKSDPDRKKPW